MQYTSENEHETKEMDLKIRKIIVTFRRGDVQFPCC